MFLRLCTFTLLSCTLPAMASTAFMPDQEDASPVLSAIFQMAQQEMPLPVLKVATWPTSEGKRQIAIVMNATGVTWAKKPVMNIMFQAKDENLQEAFHVASAAVKDFIEAGKIDTSRSSAASAAAHFGRWRHSRGKDRPAP